MTQTTRTRVFVAESFLLRSLRFTSDDLARFRDLPDSSIVTSPCFSFSAGGGPVRASRRALVQDGVRSVILVGMGDRYGAAADAGATVLEMCVASDEHRDPTPAECEALIAELEGRLGVDPIVSALRVVAR